MAWNWSKRKAAKLIRRKKSTAGDGSLHSKEVEERANQYMRKGMTRQKAFSRARQDLKQEYKRSPPRFLRGGSVSPK